MLPLPVKLSKFLCDHTVFSNTKLLTFARQGKVRVFIPSSSSLTSEFSPLDLDISRAVELMEEVTPVTSDTPIFGQDLVFLNDVLVARTPLPRYYFAFHKPENFVTMRGKAYGNKTSLEQFFAELPPGVEAVGRLDRQTSGLMLLTNDGDLNHAVLKKGALEKEYHLLLWEANLERTDPRIQKLLEGIELADGPARANDVQVLDVLQAVAYCPHQFQQCDVTGLSKNQQKKLAKMQRGKRPRTPTADEFVLLSDEAIRAKWSLISLTIAEGRNRIVRRMAKAVGLALTHLHRARFGPLQLLVPLDKRQKCETPNADATNTNTDNKNTDNTNTTNTNNTNTAHEAKVQQVELAAGSHCALSDSQRASLATSMQRPPSELYEKALRAWLLRVNCFRKQGRPNQRLERFFEANGVALLEQSFVEADLSEPEEEEEEETGEML